MASNDHSPCAWAGRPQLKTSATCHYYGLSTGWLTTNPPPPPLPSAPPQPFNTQWLMNCKITTSLWASQDSFPWILKGNAKFLPWSCQDFMGRFSFFFLYPLALVNVLLPINVETKHSNQIFKDPKVLLISFLQFIPNYSNTVIHD